MIVEVRKDFKSVYEGQKILKKFGKILELKTENLEKKLVKILEIVWKDFWKDRKLEKKFENVI